MPTTYNVQWDATAQTRAAAQLLLVQTVDPGATLATVRSGASEIGLRRLTTTMPGRTKAASFFTPAAGTGVLATTVDLDGEWEDLVSAFAAALSITQANLVNAALATGLALMAGQDTTLPPVTP